MVLLPYCQRTHLQKHLFGNISITPGLKTLEIGAVLLKIGVFTVKKRINSLKVETFFDV